MENIVDKELEIKDSKSHTYEEAEELSGHGCYNYLMLFTCCVITGACALDMFGFALIVAAASCDLNLDFTKLGILASAPFAGVIFAFPWGYYADTQGRKRAMLLSTFVGFAFAVISAFSTHWIFMLVIKFIGSSFFQASFSLSTTLLGESTGIKRRSEYLFIMNCVNVSSEIFSFGIAQVILPMDFKIALPWSQTAFRPWGLYTLILALPIAIGAVLLLFLYESPKYLFSKGDNEKALEVLRRIYEKNGGKGNYPVKSIIQTNVKTQHTNQQTLWDSLKEQTLPIFRPPLLWRTIQLYFLMSLCSTTNNAFFMWYPTLVNYFFNSFNTEESSPQTFCQRIFKETNSSIDTTEFQCNDNISLYTLYAGMAYSAFYIVVSLAILKVASRPRLLIILLLLVSGVSELLVNLKNPIANIIFFTLMQDTPLAYGSISSYFLDLYPTKHRGLVSSLCMMVARLCALVGVSVVGAVITQYCEVTFYAWSALVFGGVIVCFFLPPDRQTRSHTQDSSESKY